jgi:anti-sigma-K factor RskA
MARISLWLFVIVLGLDIGAGLYESRIVVPLWANGVPATLAAGNPFARVAIDAGVRFWAYMTTTVAILAVAALIFGLRTQPPQRTLQTVATVAELVAVAMTLLYFKPTLIRLFMGHGAGLSTEAIESTVQMWVRLSFVRIALSFGAWCVALRALALSY